jgi:hypothetical protein
MDQGDRNPREQNQYGGQNKPKKPDRDREIKRARDEQEGRDEPPRHRPGGNKSPWLGGG